MNRDFADAAERGDTLFGAAKVERASHAQAAQDCNVGLRDMAEMIGAEDLPPADLASVAGGIAAEIAKIAGGLMIEMKGRGSWHIIGVSHDTGGRYVHEGVVSLVSG